MEILNEIKSIFNDYAGLFSFIALIISWLAYRYARRNGKDSIRQQLESKQAELESINNNYFNPITSYMGFPEKMQMKLRKETLEKEIEQMKKRL